MVDTITPLLPSRRYSMVLLRLRASPYSMSATRNSSTDHGVSNRSHVSADRRIAQQRARQAGRSTGAVMRNLIPREYSDIAAGHAQALGGDGVFTEQDALPRRERKHVRPV